MSKVMSIHEYILKPEISEHQFEQAFYHAEARGLFRMAGLIDYHFCKGIKGTRKGCYTAIWIYESRAAWEHLWGTLDHPRQKHEYPKNWQIWEEEILAPLLIQDPDTINFTSYVEVLHVGHPRV